MVADLENDEFSLEELFKLQPEKKSQLAEARLAELRSFRETVNSSLLPIQSALAALKS